MHPFLKVVSPSTAKILAIAPLVALLTAMSAKSASAEDQNIAPVKSASGIDQRTAQVSTTLSAVSPNRTNRKTSRSKAKSDEITSVLQAQADAWNAGNLDKFMSSYLKSPDIIFVSADGEMRGYDALDARYRKKYGTSRDTMGKLSFSDLEIRTLGKTNALCIGRWQVERSGQANLQGIFSLVLTNVEGGWKIIHDHTSVSPTP